MRILKILFGGGPVFRIFLAAGKARHSGDCEPQPMCGTALDDGCFWGGEGLLTTHKGLSSLKREWPLWQYSPCHGASMTGFSNLQLIFPTYDEACSEIPDASKSPVS
jgi:hypothetical protein